MKNEYQDEKGNFAVGNPGKPRGALAKKHVPNDRLVEAFRSKAVEYGDLDEIVQVCYDAAFRNVDKQGRIGSTKDRELFLKYFLGIPVAMPDAQQASPAVVIANIINSKVEEAIRSAMEVEGEVIREG